MVQGSLRLIWDLAYQGITMLSIFFLYFDCRSNFNKKAAFVISLFLLMTQGFLIALNGFFSIKAFINFTVVFGIICIVFKNTLLEKIFVFFLYVFAQFFAEAVFFSAIQLFFPMANRPAFILQNKNSSFVGRISLYSWVNNLSSFIIITLVTIIMFSFFTIIKREKLNLNSRNLQPFMLLFFFQLPMVIIIDLISVSLKSSLNIILLLFALLLTFSIFLWMIWQIMITAQRTNAELELEQFLNLNQKSLNYYSHLKEQVIQVGAVRHDFNNKIEIAKFMLEEGSVDNLKTAQNIISELAEKLDELDI